MGRLARGPHEARCLQLHTFAEDLVKTYAIRLSMLWEAGDEQRPHLLLWQCPQGGWQVKQGDDEAIASWLHTLGTQLRAARRKPGRYHLGDSMETTTARNPYGSDLSGAF